MRELANERMRQMRAEREGGRTQNAERRSPSGDGTRRPSQGGSSRESRQIQPEGTEVRRPVQRSVNPEGNVRRSSTGEEVRRSSERSINPEGNVRRSSSAGSTERQRSVEGSERVRTSDESARHPQSSYERIKSTDGSARRPQSGDGTRRPAPSSKSSSSAGRSHSSEAARRSQASKSSSSAGRSKSSSSRRPAPKKQSSPYFWIGLGLYTAILLVLAFAFLKYTDKCLKQYENSQSENFMATYMETFEKNAKNGTLSPSDFTFADLDLTFADKDTMLEEYIKDLGTHSSFKAEKDPTSYITEAPVYNITADGEQVARITLKAISQTKIFAILTIMDWDIDTIEPVCSINLTNYTFSIPDGYTPVIDGIAVDPSYQTGNREEIPEFAYVSNYVTMPSYVEYKVDNVLADSEIKVLNKEGQEVAVEINGSKVKASYASASAALSEERKNEALSMIQTYEDFNTDDLSGPSHGLATVQSFLIKDSDYWNMARQWAGGVDITFTSAHTFDNPKYSNVVVDNYAEYSDVCYSLHIAFSKNMVLTRTGEKISNDFDSTVFFIYYDDSDDGIDNPHWCIADMIATTK